MTSALSVVSIRDHAMAHISASTVQFPDYAAIVYHPSIDLMQSSMPAHAKQARADMPANCRSSSEVYRTTSMKASAGNCWSHSASCNRSSWCVIVRRERARGMALLSLLTRLSQRAPSLD